MSNKRIDPETLAALLDGTLRGEARERALADLAASPEDAHLLLEASRVKAELDGAPVLPLRPSATAKLSWRRVAVGLAAVTVIGVGVARWSRPGLPPAVALAAHLAAPGDGSWTEPAWSSVRGGPAAVQDRAAAFRIGARLVDLELAARAGNEAAARALAREIAALLSGVTAGTPLAGRFERLDADAGAVERTRLRAHAADGVARLFAESPWLDAGAWLEAARIAAWSGDTSFFAPRGNALSLLDPIRSRLGAGRQPGDPDLGAGLERLDALLRAGVTRDQLAAIRAEAESLLADGAR